jgi:hypothetical protein
MNTIGITMAFITFFGIWSGHVAVRRLEYRLRNLWPTSILLALIGLALLFVSTRINLPMLSGSLGLAGLMLVIDAIELIHQEVRVKKGRAPANPTNPRHARILREYPEATIRNPLAEPIPSDGGER